MAINVNDPQSGGVNCGCAVLILQCSKTTAKFFSNTIQTNTNTTVETVNLYAQIGHTMNFQMSPRDMKMPASAQVILDAELTLANDGAGSPTADQIWGLAAAGGTSSAVHCIINGIERDL